MKKSYEPCWGDADITAAIAGCISKVYNSIIEELLNKVKDYLPDCILEILISFKEKYMKYRGV